MVFCHGWVWLASYFHNGRLMQIHSVWNRDALIQESWRMSALEWIYHVHAYISHTNLKSLKQIFTLLNFIWKLSQNCRNRKKKKNKEKNAFMNCCLPWTVMLRKLSPFFETELYALTTLWCNGWLTIECVDFMYPTKFMAL